MRSECENESRIEPTLTSLSLCSIDLAQEQLLYGTSDSYLQDAVNLNWPSPGVLLSARRYPATTRSLNSPRLLASRKCDPKWVDSVSLKSLTQVPTFSFTLQNGDTIRSKAGGTVISCGRVPQQQ